MFRYSIEEIYAERFMQARSMIITLEPQNEIKPFHLVFAQLILL